jgi:(S)-ureidoglycine aminohydrolase
MEQTLILPTQGRSTPSHFVLSPDNWVDNGLPFFDGIVVRPLATPRSTGTRFGQYLLDLSPSGRTTRPVQAGYEHFLYQLDGQLSVATADRTDVLDPGCYCFLPSGVQFSIEAAGGSGARTLLTKRLYEEVEDLGAPAAIYGRQSDVPEIVPPDPGRYVYKELIPAADRSYDMAMNVLICQPGGSIGIVEVHHQEHGLWMLTGQGIYYLNGDCVEVKPGDYIYMAPYCPQSFWPTGSVTASYLLYKDVNRDGF